MKPGRKCSLAECHQPVSHKGYCAAHAVEVLDIRRLMTELHKGETVRAKQRRRRQRPVFRDPRQDHDRHHGGCR